MVANEQMRTLTAAAFWEVVQQPEYADVLTELIAGEMITMSKPGLRHGQVVFELSFQIALHVREHGLGRVFAAETGFLVERDPDTVRGIDVAFVRADRLPEGGIEGIAPFAPDFAAEVVSPHNSALDMQKKVLQLLRAGTQLVWVVYPELQVVTVYTPDRIAMFSAGDTLDGGDVLPGFKLKVSAVFA